jgi:cytochrome c5
MNKLILLSKGGAARLTGAPGRALQMVLLAACVFASIAISPGAAGDDPAARRLSLMAANCLQCHARAETGAPQMGDADAWRVRLEAGEDALLGNTIAGVRGMPPLGYCSACDEADFRALIGLLVGRPLAAGAEAPSVGSTATTGDDMGERR